MKIKGSELVARERQRERQRLEDMCGGPAGMRVIEEELIQLREFDEHVRRMFGSDSESVRLGMVTIRVRRLLDLAEHQDFESLEAEINDAPLLIDDVLSLIGLASRDSRKAVGTMGGKALHDPANENSIQAKKRAAAIKETRGKWKAERDTWKRSRVDWCKDVAVPWLKEAHREVPSVNPKTTISARWLKGM